VVLSRGALHSGGPYRCPDVRIRARATRTNTPPNGAFRGFGAPQVEFAAETHLNRIAEQLGISPLDIRRRNLYVPGDATPTGQVLRDSVGAEEVLERAAEAAEFASCATVQVLGGMGFTFEHDAHLYAKRTLLLGQLFGGRSLQLSRLLELPEAL